MQNRSYYGTVDCGRDVEIVTIKNSFGVQCSVLSYGCILNSWCAPLKDGSKKDIVLGFDSLTDYLSKSPYFGCTVGRVAGRITEGKFSIDGQEYSLVKNDPPNHLHGGERGLDKRVWEISKVNENSVLLTYESPDGEEGYPGNVTFSTEYKLCEDGALEVNYTAISDLITPVNLTHHSYFNLSEEATILNHQLYIDAQNYVDTDSYGTSKHLVDFSDGKGCSFQSFKRISEVLDEITFSHGDNYKLNSSPKDSMTSYSASLRSPKGDLELRVFTTEPYLQLYLGKGLMQGMRGKRGREYGPFSGLCLECQRYPNGMNQPSMGNILLRSGELYESKTRYQLVEL